MAITTLDLALAGMQPPVFFMKGPTPALVIGRPHSLFYQSGMPGAAVASSNNAAGVAFTDDPGELTFNNPVSGNSYLARFMGCCTVPGTLLLCDRLWDNSGLSATLTTAQTVNSATWPARDRNGATLGDDVRIAVEISAATGAGAPVYTMGYTNSAGVASKTGTGILTGVASSPVGAFYPIGLQAGDQGVRSIQTFTANASHTSGSIKLVAYRVLASLELTQANAGNALDLVTGGFPKLYNNSVPFLVFIPSAVTPSTIIGTMTISQG